MENVFMKILRLFGLAAKPSEAVVKDVCVVVPPACDVVEHDNIICQKEAYAVLSPEGKTFTFYFDEKKSSRQGKVCGLNVENHCPEWVMMDYYATPLLMIGDITTVVFDESFKDARPVSCAYWFGGFVDLTKIEGISNLNTSEVTDMRGMFCRCQSLSSLDLSNFDTSKVTDMGDMFFCCKVLGSLDLSNFNTSKVTDMYAMFWCCERLQSLDVSNFNTSNVTNMYGMFSYCKSLKTIYVGTGWNTNKLEESEDMFRNCTSLVGGKGTKYDSKFVDVARAKIDGGKDEPGYFNLKLES